MDPGLSHQVPVTGFAKDKAGVQGWGAGLYLSKLSLGR